VKSELVLVEDHPLLARSLVRLLSPHFLVAWSCDPIAARRVVMRARVLVCAAHFGERGVALLRDAAHAIRLVYGDETDAWVSRSDAIVCDPTRVLEALTALCV
jgi:hypothetical protein